MTAARREGGAAAGSDWARAAGVRVVSVVSAATVEKPARRNGRRREGTEVKKRAD